MARQPSITFEQNFSQGLITQTAGLNFPDNACTETYNCIFKETGLVARRPQFDFEDQYVTENHSRTQAAMTTYRWKGAAAEGDYDIVVVQIGQNLFFYDANADGSMSNGYFSTSSIDMSSYATNTNPGLQECTFASGLGYLFVFHPSQEPIYITYNPAARTFSATEITVQIRDVSGIADTLGVDERSTSITDAHKYNLYNQGWNVTLDTTTPFATWDTARTDYPSNADVWWDYKDDTGTFQITYVANFNRGKAQAPRGYYILDLFDQQRDALSGLSIADVTYVDRPAVGAFFAGRVWYSAIGDVDLNNHIYYSQIIDDPVQFGRCYQENDPTSETFSLLLPTDGGVISIPEMGTLYRLEQMGNHLIAFASNGIWSITGSQGIGFAPNDYTVTFISNVRSISSTNFVNLQGAIVWWNLDGIYSIQIGQGGFQVQSLTDQRIKDFFAGIPVLSKKQARGSFNSLTHVVQWLYRTDVNDSFEDIYKYNAVLNLNVLSGAFYPWTIPESDVSVHGIVVVETSGQSRFQAFDVTANSGADLVKDASSNQVIAYNYSAFVSAVTTTKYLVAYGTDASAEFTWAETATFTPPDDYLDWFKYDGVGVDYDSYFISGYKIRGQGVFKSQSTYLNVFSYSQKESPIVYDVQARWDYAIQSETGKWTNQQRVNIPTSDYSFQRRRLKIRGRGVTVQFKFSSISGQPFNVAGWGIYETSNTGV